MQANKQSKVVWQQLQIPATKLRRDFSKVYFIFLLFYFDLQLKQTLFIFLVLN